MKKKIFAFLIGFILVIGPTVTSAAVLIPDCNRGTTVNATNTGLGTACDFNSFMLLINNVISFLLFTIATPLVALIVCYVGFIMLTSGGSSEKVTKAKHIFWNVIVGYIIGLAAWLIVKTILTTVGFDPKDAFLQ